MPHIKGYYIFILGILIWYCVTVHVERLKREAGGQPIYIAPIKPSCLVGVVTADEVYQLFLVLPGTNAALLTPGSLAVVEGHSAETTLIMRQVDAADKTRVTLTTPLYNKIGCSNITIDRAETSVWHAEYACSGFFCKLGTSILNKW